MFLHAAPLTLMYLIPLPTIGREAFLHDDGKRMIGGGWTSATENSRLEQAA